MTRNKEGWKIEKRGCPQRLTARITHHDFRFDPENEVLRIAVLSDKWVELRLQWYSELDNYLDGSWSLGETLVSCKDGEMQVYPVFKKGVTMRKLNSKEDYGVASEHNPIIVLEGSIVA